jgi:hypothetical protein
MRRFASLIQSIAFRKVAVGRDVRDTHNRDPDALVTYGYGTNG